MPIKSFTDKDNEITKVMLEYMSKKKKKKVRLIDILNDDSFKPTKSFQKTINENS